MNRRISVNTGSAVPQSFITKGKQRLKQHTDTVYLKDGDEFEIELYNPKNNKVLAKIELNGNSIGNGIVLRPGERIFLERHLDEAKKFKFDTYLVNGNNVEVENAIRNNGDVIIRFYDEYFPLWNSSTTTWTVYPNTYTYWTGGATTLTNTDTYTTGTGGATGSNGINQFYVNDGGFTNQSSLSSSTVTNAVNVNNNGKRSLETGRVEKGSNSSQTFDYDNATFNYFASVTNWWKIKPQSTKPLVAEDLVVYCTECGAKRKKDNHKFCPHCGTKY